jgi:hypothetical protein
MATIRKMLENSEKKQTGMYSLPVRGGGAARLRPDGCASRPRVIEA